MSEHHPTLSPSSFPAMSLCPKFQSDGKTSDAADEGTKQHKELEYLIFDDGEDTGREVNSGVLWAYDRVRALFKTPQSEVKLSLLRNFQEITFGTADVVGYLYDGMLAVGDYKSGIQRDSSAQLAVYALMAMQRFGETVCKCFVWFGRDEWEESWVLTLAEAEEIVYSIIAERQVKNPTPVICEYCNWCKHNGTCEATTEAIVTVATGYDDPVDIADIDTWHASEITDPAQMAKVYAVAQYLSKWADGAKNSVKQAAIKGMEIPGYTLRNGAKKRKIDNIEGAYEISSMTPTEFLSCCAVSVADLEKLVKEKYSIKGKKALKEEMSQRFGEFIYIKEDAPSLVQKKEKK